MSTLNLAIEGMTCGGCSKSIIARLNKFDFTDSVEVDWEKGTGTIEITQNFEENKNLIIKTLDQLGFDGTAN